ncbi:LysR family transcriptional regulator [Paraburkholderia silvatlantica]|uniref:DNA-binding transcriptional LysR family regulator n=1 Tax=Paraburkholderia silvatlantica TaxID=321895 RepID=A0ABR6FKF1_9BURK|nr:LysR family transcriptional regulator [Paraburkholderia silvatlantica]MBB2927901.1 DNA-binding transcriptional LysR family regulator [Paraburkholderia silvatlantica]PVY27536.1 DNA-binding transcriptional LysR family regulator [Paraburkholderia silvatlantica]PXW34509.1 DNA-binding transcriptional LysR family regulator [Paraburkholderia silvatlantica]
MKAALPDEPENNLWPVQFCTARMATGKHASVAVNINRLSWDDLRIFLAVARAGNLSKAGRLLGIDHATVGRRISALEFALETPVFERDRQGYRLNAQGREMLGLVEAVEANVLTLGDLLNGEQPGLAGHVRIATMEGIASLYLSEQFVDFKRRQPGITIELVTSSTDVRISHREADLFIGFFEPRGSNLEIRQVGRFTLHLYAHPDYLAQVGTPQTVDDLKRHRFVGYIDDLIQLDAVRWLDDAVHNPSIALHSTSMIAQMFAAAAGGGLVMLPAFSRAERFGLVPVLAGEITVARDVWMSSHQYLRRVPRIRAAAAFLIEIMERDYPPGR